MEQLLCPASLLAKTQSIEHGGAGFRHPLGQVPVKSHGAEPNSLLLPSVQLFFFSNHSFFLAKLKKCNITALHSLLGPESFRTPAKRQPKSAEGFPYSSTAIDCCTCQLRSSLTRNVTDYIVTILYCRYGK